MTDFRRWLAGVLGQLAVWLYPPYPQRHSYPGAIPPPHTEVLAWMESRGWNN